MGGDLAQARRLKAVHEDELLARPGVAGVGLRSQDGHVHIAVYVQHGHANIRDEIPDHFGSIRVMVIETGPFEFH